MTDLDTVLLTTKDVAARWRCSEHYVKLLRGQDRGPSYVRVGGRAIRYRLADVLAWEQAQVYVTAPAAPEPQDQ